MIGVIQICRIHSDGSKPHLIHFFISSITLFPSSLFHQGQGYGTDVMTDALERLKKAGKTVFILSSNAKNLRFYNKHGFHVMVQSKFRDATLYGLAKTKAEASWRQSMSVIVVLKIAFQMLRRSAFRTSVRPLGRPSVRRTVTPSPIEVFRSRVCGLVF